MAHNPDAGMLHSLVLLRIRKVGEAIPPRRRKRKVMVLGFRISIICCVMIPIPRISGHVSLMQPSSRFQNPSGIPGSSASVFPTSLLEAAGGCHNFGCLWFNQGCQPGCSKCSDNASMPVSPASQLDEQDTCSEPGGTMKPTITDPHLRTYRNDAKTGADWTVLNPWRSPGHSPVFSPCGLSGGGNSPGSWLSDSLTKHIRSGAVTPPFIRRGVDARNVPAGPKAQWQAGSVQDVGWSIFANKGGGYAWRLCPKSRTGQPDNVTLTEECFQAGHLEYVSDLSWIQYGGDGGGGDNGDNQSGGGGLGGGADSRRGIRKTGRTYFNASRVSEGTWPSGSTWTKNPVPPCANPDGSPVVEPQNGCPGPMFEPAVPGLFGDGVGSCITWAIHGPVEGYHTLYDSFGAIVYQAPCTSAQALAMSIQFQFSIFDAVKVPASLMPGEYVLSFRLDAELTPQVWSQCADITVTPPKSG